MDDTVWIVYLGGELNRKGTDTRIYCRTATVYRGTEYGSEAGSHGLVADPGKHVLRLDHSGFPYTGSLMSNRFEVTSLRRCGDSTFAVAMDVLFMDSEDDGVLEESKPGRLVLVCEQFLLTDGVMRQSYWHARYGAALSALHCEAAIHWIMKDAWYTQDGKMMVSCISSDGAQGDTLELSGVNGQCPLVSGHCVTDAWISPDGGTVAVRFGEEPTNVFNVVLHRGDTQRGHEVFSWWRDLVWHADMLKVKLDRTRRTPVDVEYTVRVNSALMMDGTDAASLTGTVSLGNEKDRTGAVMLLPFNNDMLTFSVLAWPLPLFEHDDAFGMLVDYFVPYDDNQSMLVAMKGGTRPCTARLEFTGDDARDNRRRVIELLEKIDVPQRQPRGPAYFGVSTSQRGAVPWDALRFV